MTDKQPSFDRGCQGKSNLGNKSYKKSADKFAKKHGKNYSVYRFPHCGGTHLTTKPVDNSYAPILYQTTTQENNSTHYFIDDPRCGASDCPSTALHVVPLEHCKNQLRQEMMTEQLTDEMQDGADWWSEQVIEWLKNNTDDYICVDYDMTYFLMENFLDDLKKAMRPATTQENN